jgi:hypothetical protein
MKQPNVEAFFENVANFKSMCTQNYDIAFGRDKDRVERSV